MFAWDLALHCRYPHPDRMLAEMTPGQFNEAVAYSRMRPFGDEQLTRLFGFALNQFGGDVDLPTLRERAEEPTGEASKAETAAAIERL